MAKYTDPNTGVKYSTHTGLKVFTVIVVILLVVSIVFNVVLYMQSSEESELDAESGELDGGYGDGDNGEGDESNGASSEGEDGENLDGALPDDGDGTPSESESDFEPEDDGESGEDEEEPDDGHDFPELEEDDEDDGMAIIENENAIRTSGFDENGVATGVYYYPSHYWNADTDNPFYGCAYCGCECLGHTVYFTTSGGIYFFYPDTIVEYKLEAADGSETDINSKMKVALIFELGWKGDSVVFDGLSYDMYPSALEISSLTGEPLQIESVEVRQYVYIDAVYDNRGVMQKQVEYHSESGIDKECRLDTDWSTDLTHMYTYGGNGGSFTVYITMTDGSIYTFEYWAVYTQGLEVQHVA